MVGPTASAAEAAMNAYLDALDGRDGSPLPYAPDVRATQNGAPADVAEGLRATARAVRYRRLLSDPSQGQVAAFAVVEERAGGLAIAFLRMRLDADGRITELEVFDAREGQTSQFDAEAMITAGLAGEDVVQPGAPTPRAAMISASEAYFQGIERNDGSAVPTELTCERVSNGNRSTLRPAPGATESPVTANLKNLRYIEVARDRRHIVDEARGLILTLCVFDLPGGTFVVPRDDGPETRVVTPRSTRIAELFAIRGGRIARIDVVMRDAELGAPSGW